MIYYASMPSPIGVLHLLATDQCLIEVVFEKGWAQYSKGKSFTPKKNEILKLTIQELKDYFSGKLKKFTIPLDFKGTEFQVKTWKALLTIPYGETVSYSEQAKRIQKPKAVRFVGTTNGKNPIPVIVPCHRVIGKNGSLTGYGGGLSIKKYLLELESSAEI